MRLRTMAIAGVACGCAMIGLAQMRGRVWAKYEAEMQDPVDDPPDALRKAEFALGRLRYRSPLDRGWGRYSRWGIDVNKGDRTFIALLRRLTRIDVQAIETIVDAGSDEVYGLPWILAVSAGDWRLSPQEALRLGEYLKRGGFLMVDDFHNDREWAQFMDGVRQMNLAAQAEEMEDSDSAFHVVFDLKERVRVPGANVVHGTGVERGGTAPHWRAIRDAKGRMVIAICFNMDVGDGWEFADDPEYPERFSSEAIRLGVNYVMYALTH